MSYLRNETTEGNSNISRNTESSMVKSWSRSNEMSGQRLLSHSGLLFELLVSLDTGLSDHVWPFA
jgi:hypothetical protein